MLPNPCHSNSPVVTHVPVMPAEVADLLALRPGDTVVDCTFGAGGHAAELEPRLGEGGTYVAVDRDADVAGHFERFAAGAHARTRFVHGDFALVLRNMAATGARADAILMDLGMSSMQVDTLERGFSYVYDAPLDMRMDPRQELTAADLVADWDERQLARLFRDYGEERYAAQIARAIVRERARRPLQTTNELVDVITNAIPVPARFGGGHPAKRVFQAIRIAVNEELDQLDRALPLAWDLLRPNGRFAGISFHSLEDRRVKRFLAARAQGCICPPDLPICRCGREPEAELVTRRGVVATPGEIAHNPRAKSARMRVARKLEASPT
jgi:16S rRNA (cytosine1402-N4)-methyltransferase